MARERGRRCRCPTVINLSDHGETAVVPVARSLGSPRLAVAPARRHSQHALPLLPPFATVASERSAQGPGGTFSPPSAHFMSPVAQTSGWGGNSPSPICLPLWIAEPRAALLTPCSHLRSQHRRRPSSAQTTQLGPTIVHHHRHWVSTDGPFLQPASARPFHLALRGSAQCLTVFQRSSCCLSLYLSHPAFKPSHAAQPPFSNPSFSYMQRPPSSVGSSGPPHESSHHPQPQLQPQAEEKASAALQVHLQAEEALLPLGLLLAAAVAVHPAHLRLRLGQGEPGLRDLQLRHIALRGRRGIHTTTTTTKLVHLREGGGGVADTTVVVLPHLGEGGPAGEDEEVERC